MRYQVVLEYDPDTGHHTAIVPGLPGIFVDAKSEREAVKLAKEAIGFYLDEASSSSRLGPPRPGKPLPAKVVVVEL